MPPDASWFATFRVDRRHGRYVASRVLQRVVCRPFPIPSSRYLQRADRWAGLGFDRVSRRVRANDGESPRSPIPLAARRGCGSAVGVVEGQKKRGGEVRVRVGWSDPRADAIVPVLSVHSTTARRRTISISLRQQRTVRNARFDRFTVRRRNSESLPSPTTTKPCAGPLNARAPAGQPGDAHASNRCRDSCPGRSVGPTP
jgi:hypothetical protein